MPNLRMIWNFFFVLKSARYYQVESTELGFSAMKVTKGPILSEKYWYYFNCPKNVLRSILSFVFWIFPPLDTAVQLESADSKQNTISKSLFQDSFWHIFWAMRKMHHTFWKKGTFTKRSLFRGIVLNRQFNGFVKFSSIDSIL